MKAEEFLTREMWDKVDSYSRHVIGSDWAQGWDKDEYKSTTLGIYNELNNTDSSNSLEWLSWLLFGIFAERVMALAKPEFQTAIITLALYVEWCSKRSQEDIYENNPEGFSDYPHIAMFEYLKEIEPI